MSRFRRKNNKKLYTSFTQTHLLSLTVERAKFMKTIILIFPFLKKKTTLIMARVQKIAVVACLNRILVALSFRLEPFSFLELFDSFLMQISIKPPFPTSILYFYSVFFTNTLSQNFQNFNSKARLTLEKTQTTLQQCLFFSQERTIAYRKVSKLCRVYVKIIIYAVVIEIYWHGREITPICFNIAPDSLAKKVRKSSFYLTDFVISKSKHHQVAVL